MLIGGLYFWLRSSELMSGLDSTLEVDKETLKSVLVDNVSDANGLYCTNQLEKIKDSQEEDLKKQMN